MWHLLISVLCAAFIGDFRGQLDIEAKEIFSEVQYGKYRARVLMLAINEGSGLILALPTFVPNAIILYIHLVCATLCVLKSISYMSLRRRLLS